MVWTILLAVAIAYLLGSIPSAYIVGRLKKGRDIRRMGGGNPGAFNVFREVGPGAGIAVLFTDMAKGAGAVLIAQAMGLPQEVKLLAGLVAVIGHDWSPFLQFKGGKGLATTLGVLSALVPREIAIILGIVAIPIFITRNLTLSVAIGLVFLPLVVWQFGGSGMLIGYSAALPALCGIRHIPTAREAIAASHSKRDFIFDRWRNR